nr:MAG TPA: hypothetical protein [Caudoviricetes sp.]
MIIFKIFYYDIYIGLRPFSNYLRPFLLSSTSFFICQLLAEC